MFWDVKVWGLAFRVSGLALRVWGLGLGVSGFRVCFFFFF